MGQTTPKLGFQQLAAPTQQESQEPASLCSLSMGLGLHVCQLDHAYPSGAPELKQSLPQWPQEVGKE